MQKTILFDEITLEIRGPALPGHTVQKLHKRIQAVKWSKLLKETLKEFPKVKVVNTSSGSPR